MGNRQSLLARLKTRLLYRWLAAKDAWRLARLTRRVAQEAPEASGRPVVFFNASARLEGVSLNAAFQMLAAWGLRLAGVPVLHFVCRAGMSRCVLGTKRDAPGALPPCARCVAQSRLLYADGEARWFPYLEEEPLREALEGLGLEALSAFEYQGRPLGELALPSLRWAMRRHHLRDDEATRFLLRQYILSAHNVAREFSALLDRENPAAVVVFNGILFPEATARWMAQRRGLPVVTHEVGFQPFSGFFTHGHATIYPIDIPADFEMTAAQDARLDAYLSRRFRGQFTMAGIRFWPQMRGLDGALLRKVESFEQVVPVFTNVIFDTSQTHANTVFPHMFAWLDLIHGLIKAHPDTLFVIRAHPDEMRPGKESRESVRRWVREAGVDRLPNAVFIPSREYLSSYDLIRRSKFVMVYNSSVGLEATLLGAAVLCGGKARYTQYPTVFFPQTVEGYRRQAEEFLEAQRIHMPAEFTRNARRFLYYQIFRASLPFDGFLKPHPRPGYVRFKSFDPDRLRPERFPTMRALEKGILEERPFLLREGG